MELKTVELDGEKIYLKRSMGSYRVVFPHKVDGKINWFNFIIGGWENLFLVLFIMFLTLSFYYIYWHDTREMQKVLNDPCSYCSTDNMKTVINLRVNKKIDSFNGGEDE